MGRLGLNIPETIQDYQKNFWGIDPFKNIPFLNPFHNARAYGGMEKVPKVNPPKLNGDPKKELQWDRILMFAFGGLLLFSIIFRR